MNDLLSMFRLICVRRGVTLVKVENVLLNTAVNFGLATNTAILPAAAGTFYYIQKLWVLGGPTLTGAPLFRLNPNSGQGSGGTIVYIFPLGNVLLRYEGVEVNDMRYEVNTHSAGAVYFGGLVFKVSYV